MAYTGDEKLSPVELEVGHWELDYGRESLGTNLEAKTICERGSFL